MPSSFAKNWAGKFRPTWHRLLLFLNPPPLSLWHCRFVVLSAALLLHPPPPRLSQSPLLSGILRSLWWSLFELTLSLAVVSNWASFSGIPVGDFSLSLPTCSCFGVESLPLAEIWGGNSAFVSFGSLYEEISFWVFCHWGELVFDCSLSWRNWIDCPTFVLLWFWFKGTKFARLCACGVAFLQTLSF